MSVPTLTTAATPPLPFEAREMTPSTNCALSDPMSDSNCRWISALVWSCPKTKPANATTRSSSGAREKIAKNATEAARTGPSPAITSPAAPYSTPQPLRRVLSICRKATPHDDGRRARVWMGGDGALADECPPPVRRARSGLQDAQDGRGILDHRGGGRRIPGPASL